jgi:hypothetical protein
MKNAEQEHMKTSLEKSQEDDRHTTTACADQDIVVQTPDIVAQPDAREGLCIPENPFVTTPHTRRTTRTTVTPPTRTAGTEIRDTGTSGTGIRDTETADTEPISDQ